MKSGPPPSRGWGKCEGLGEFGVGEEWVSAFVLRQAQDERRGGGLEFEEDGFDFFDVSVGGEAPHTDVAAAQVSVDVPIGGNGDPFVVNLFPVVQEFEGFDYALRGGSDDLARRGADLAKVVADFGSFQSAGGLGGKGDGDDGVVGLPGVWQTREASVF